MVADFDGIEHTNGEVVGAKAAGGKASKVNDARTPRVGFVGKGALGMLFCRLAQDRLGAENACFIMDDERYGRHVDDVYEMNGEVVKFCDVRFSEACDGEPFDVLLVAVKSPGLPAALDMVKALTRDDTVVIPLLNGVTSERKCAEAIGWDHVVGCVSYGMDAARFGTRLEYSKTGELLIGLANDETPRSVLERADEVLSAAGIPHAVVQDVNHRLWSKFIANVGLNQVCAVFGLVYEQLFEDETSEAFRTYVGAMREVIAVANAEGVALTEEDMNSYVAIARGLGPKSTPSMAQDRINKNPSEVDEFSGEIIRLAQKHGLLVPCNRFLNARVHEYEAQF